MILPVLTRFVSCYITIFAILIFVFGKITIPSSTKGNLFMIIDNCIIFFTFSVSFLKIISVFLNITYIFSSGAFHFCFYLLLFSLISLLDCFHLLFLQVFAPLRQRLASFATVNDSPLFSLVLVFVHTLLHPWVLQVVRFHHCLHHCLHLSSCKHQLLLIYLVLFLDQYNE